MKSVGIIAEYNPFHNGHLYHLNEVKKMFPDSVIVLILGGNFTERGDLSILNKWEKTEIALHFGVDLVVLLPFPYATASSDIFAEGAIELCHELGVSDLVFGSETDDIKGMELLVDTQLHHPDFNALVQVYLRMGKNYPTALSLALKELTGLSYSLPNDLLGISYIKAIKKNHYNIKAHTIKRENNYHDKTLQDNISSATSIREALLKKEDITNQVPSFVLPYLKKERKTINDYFPYLKYKILTEENLEDYPFIDSGMKKKLKKEIDSVDTIDELIHHIKSKNTTYNKLSRMLLYLLCGYTKKRQEKEQAITYIRLLGFNKKGQRYLKEKKKEIKLPIISKFTREQESILNFEYITTKIYALVLPYEEGKKLIEMEYKRAPIRKDDEND